MIDISKANVDKIISHVEKAQSDLRKEGFKGRAFDEELIISLRYFLTVGSGWRIGVCKNCLGSGYEKEAG